MNHRETQIDTEDSATVTSADARTDLGINLQPSTFDEWHARSPADAARTVHERVRTRLSLEQQRAVVAWMPTERALTEAFAAPAPTSGALRGVPFFLKDLFDERGAPTFAGSTFLPEVRSVHRGGALVKDAIEAGLVCAGKTQLHEFAYGITGENPHYGDCEHPRAPGRTSGGSSSGSAAAVAAGIVPLAFGTDTGGSIRVPAAFCGLYGLRLTPGHPWIRDAFPLASSFDTAGWFTANSADMRSVVAALIGLRATERPLRGCYVEWPGLDAPIAGACRAAAVTFTQPADAIVAAELSEGFRDAATAYNTIVATEAWAIHAPWAERYQDRYDPAVWQRLNRARSLTDTDRMAADETRRRVHATWARYFLAFDYLVMPATPCAALTKSECTLENRTRILALTAPASVGGLPTLTLPVRLADSPLTAGLQVVFNHPRSPVLSWALAMAEEQRGGVFV